MIYDAILLDFDGVLADTEPLHYECWRDVSARYGVELSHSDYDRKLRGLCGYELVEALRRIPEPPVPESAIQEIYHGKLELFRERSATFQFISEATAALIRPLSRDYPLAIVSSARRPHIFPAIERAGIAECFRTVVSRDDVARPKPAPEPYRLAARRLGAKRPLVVEDSAAGLASGRAAGFATVEVKGNLADVLEAALNGK